MKHKHVTTKIWEDTLPKLRLIYALTGESMVSIIDRLITQELERIQRVQPEQSDDGKARAKHDQKSL